MCPGRCLALLIALASVSCSEPALVLAPPNFPEFPVPDDNPLTAEKIELGRRLFYEKALSSDSTVSCGSCHLQSLAFTDGRKVSAGVHGSLGQRNASGLQNLAYSPNFFMDGGIATLEMQVEAPLGTEDEMNLNYHLASERLNADEAYRNLFISVFGKEADAFGISRAIAAFERTMISGNSIYDQAERGDIQLSEEEALGKELFFSERVGCSGCHSGFLFTDFTLANVGLYESYVDTGYARISMNPNDHGKFKVPSLRNVAVTAPYFHDGSVETLEEALTHFLSGGLDHSVKDPRMKVLEITKEEKEAILAFLYTLTDNEFLCDPRFSDPKEK